MFYHATLQEGLLIQRKSLSGAACPVARSLDVIGDWWSLLIVRDALRGMCRFSDFHNSLGVSRNILTRRLCSLVRLGILERTAASDGGAYREYHLTAKGRGLFNVLVALGQWGQEYLPAPVGKCMALVDREHRQPVRRIEVRAGDGRLLGPDDTIMARVG